MNSEIIWKIQKKIVERYEKYGKYGRKVFFYKTINTACNLFKFCNLFLQIKSYVPYCNAKSPHRVMPPTAALSPHK
jgi:hypothetical protein